MNILVSFLVEQQRAKLETVASANITFLCNLAFAKNLLATGKENSGFPGHRREARDSSQMQLIPPSGANQLEI